MYPVMLNLENKRVVIIGGGKVATGKVHNLINEKAMVVVISPEITDELYTYVLSGNIHWINRAFQQEDTKDAFLVIAATNSRDVNNEVKKNCENGQLINIVDAPKMSNFFNTAIIERGQLKIAISTEGASPLLAKRIKDDINSILEDGYDQYLKFLQEARSKILISVHEEKRKKYLLQLMLDDIYRKNEVERDYFLQHILK